MVRRLRLLGIIPDVTGRVSDETAIRARELVVGLVLSIVPGLAQLVAGRFREIRWYLPGWLVAFTVGIFLYGSRMGYVLLGLAVGLHAWMAFAHTLHKLLDEIYEKLMGLVLLIVAVAFFYWGIRTFAFADFVWGYTSLTIPQYKIEPGDCLLARRSLANSKALPRGCLALTRLQETGRRGLDIMSNYMMAEVVGLPGEEIRLAGNIFHVNGRALDPNVYPVPNWLRGRGFVITIAPSRYFISSEYRVFTQGRNVAAADIERTCVLGKDRLEAIAIMKWLPVNRRGFIKEAE